jgi:WD40 repeat protein
VPGRVAGLELAPDKQSFAVSTSAKSLMRFSTDGSLLWQTNASPCQIVRFSPDGKTLVGAGGDGVVRLFDAASGKLKSETDLNVYNKITADAYVKQPRMGELPVDVGSTAHG